MIARTAAENLDFMMRIKDLEAQVERLENERDEARLSAGEQQGPWFDQVRAEVERRLIASMATVEEAEARAEAIELTRKQEEEMWRNKLIEAEVAAAESAERESELGALLAEARRMGQEAEAACNAAQRGEEEARVTESEARAEVRVLLLECRSLRERVVEGQAREEDLRDRVQRLERTVAITKGQAEQAQRDAGAARRELDEQKGMNEEVMSRKEEVEWELMRSLAALRKATSGLSPGPGVQQGPGAVGEVGARDLAGDRVGREGNPETSGGETEEGRTSREVTRIESSASVRSSMLPMESAVGSGGGNVWSEMGEETGAAVGGGTRGRGRGRGGKGGRRGRRGGEGRGGGGEGSGGSLAPSR